VTNPTVGTARHGLTTRDRRPGPNAVAIGLRVVGSPQVFRTMTLTEAHRSVVEPVAEALAR